MKTTSLCPVLGKKHAQVFTGVCPLHTISPSEKMLRISYGGPRPYIMTHVPISGSDYILTRLLAKKHGFIPSFISLVESNLTRVSLVKKTKIPILTRILN